MISKILLKHKTIVFQEELNEYVLNNWINYSQVISTWGDKEGQEMKTLKEQKTGHTSVSIFPMTEQ